MNKKFEVTEQGVVTELRVDDSITFHTICGHKVQKNRFFGPRGLKQEDYFFILIHDIKHT
jgi:hypothetical protein